MADVILSPQIYVIGRLKLDMDEVGDFLADYETEWTNDLPFDGSRDLDLAAEFAGRQCYDAFGKAQYRKENGAYINNIVEQAHGCYDEATDVLTVQGWKSWPNVTEDDLLATRADDGCIEYQKPTRLVHYFHRGRMYRVEAPGVDLLVTPRHKMLACPTSTKEGRKRADYRLIAAEDLSTRSHAYVKDANWAFDGQPYLPDDVARLLGFSIGDGYLKSGSIAHFHLRKERKILWLRSVCHRLGWKLREDSDEHFHVAIAPEFHALFCAIYDGEREKVIPQDILTQSSAQTQEALLEGLMQADGHRGKTGDSFDTTSKRLADQFQQLCLHVGLAAHVCYSYDADRRPSSFGKKPLIRMSIIRRGLRPEVNKFAGQLGRSYWLDDWEGDVYCAEVPNHTLYVRRNGIPVWSGNSVLEHPTVMLLVTGVSRSLTHELIRHRVGVAYSQRSQRYVNEEDAKFVIPPLLVHSQRAHTLWEQAIESISDAYSELVNELSAELAERNPDLTARERRIQARQAARSILPNATETRIVVTANMRTLRHICEVRGGIGAESEIRRFACILTSVMKHEAPNIFADIEITTLDDGQMGVRVAHHKV